MISHSLTKADFDMILSGLNKLPNHSLVTFVRNGDRLKQASNEERERRCTSISTRVGCKITIENLDAAMQYIKYHSARILMSRKDEPAINDRNRISYELDRILDLRKQGMIWRLIGEDLGKTGIAVVKFVKRHKPDFLDDETLVVRVVRAPHSLETRAKMKASHMGKRSGFIGHHHSEETKAKMSDMRIGRKRIRKKTVLEITTES